MGMESENSQETCRSVVRVAIIYLVVNRIGSFTLTKNPTWLCLWLGIRHRRKHGLYCDPPPLRSQPWRLLDEHQNLNWPDENDKAIAEDKVTFVDSLNSLSLSDSEELDNQQTWLDDIWRDFLTAQSFRYKFYFSACCLKDIIQLGDLIRRYPEDLFCECR